MQPGEINTAFLCKLYVAEDQPFSLDKLPYSESFDTLVVTYNAETRQRRSHRDLWIQLIELRKRGYLPKRGRKKK